MKIILLVLAILLLAGPPAALLFLSAPITLEFAPEPKALGPSNNIGVRVTSPHGIRSLTLRLQQGATVITATQQETPDRLFFWKKKLAPAAHHLVLPAGADKGFKSGPAKLSAEAVANDLGAATVTRTIDVIVNLEPPRITADTEQHYINQGGAELVTFSVSGYFTESGVKVGDHKFRSFPRPGGKGENDRFCLFAFPWDTPAGTVPLVYAANPAGQEVTAPFWFRIKPKKFRQRTLDLTDQFMDKVNNELDPGGTGDRVQRFLKINGEMRRANNATLAGLRDQTERRVLWTPPFQQLSNSKVEAFFADVRTYRYEKKKIDQQVHLGFDLSKVKQAPVVASNTGKVVHAAPLGIYGNCVVLDHGYGLQSIYAHLSAIGVKPGQTVERGAEFGRSGATGMAGGDHLHFSMQIDGVQVNPVEWWDPHWLKDRILSKVPQIP